MSLALLLKKKADAVAKAKAIHEVAARENRITNDEEDTNFRAAMTESSSYDAKIADARALIEAERNAETVTAAQAGAPGNVREFARPGTSAGHNNREDAPWDNVGEFLNAVKVATVTSSRVIDDRLHAAQGQQETVDAEGGFLVRPEYATEILQRSYNEGLIVSRCDRTPMGSARLVLPRIDENSRKNGFRYGGIQVYRASEAGQYTPTKGKLAELTLTANKLIALTFMTDELLEDANAAALNSWVFQNVPKAIAFQEDLEVFSGTGQGQFLGFMNSGALVTVAKDASQPTATISTTNLLNMYARFWGGSRMTGCWFYNQDMEGQLMNLTRGAGVAVEFVFKLPGDRGNTNAYATIFGIPAIPVEQASTTGTTGDIVLFDGSQYILGERGGMKVDTSIHVAFLTGEQAFRWTVRNDGQPKWPAPLTPFQGSATQSPFIALQTRP